MASLDVMILGDLPADIILRILEFLRLRDRRRTLTTSRSLWSLRLELESKSRRLTVPTHRYHSTLSARLLPGSGGEGVDGEETGPYWIGRDVLTLQPPMDLQRCPGGAASFLGRMRNLVVLDIDGLATDEILEAVAGVDTSTELMKNLRHISMVGSAGVTDRGLEFLSRGSHRAENLVSIDLTFCRSTTYSGTFPLRDRLHNLALIRRQPKWLDGSFVTPFKGADELTVDELHIYWADGSFHFNRGLQSEGFVVDLFPLEEGAESNTERKFGDEGPWHLGDRLQYTNFEPPQSWPGWARYCYRPGVSLLHLPFAVDGLAVEAAGQKLDDTSETRAVLVAQCLEGLRAPLHALNAHKHDVALVPLGESRTFNRDGAIIAGVANGISDATRHPDSHTLISRMKVLPLPDGGKLMPPPEIVARNRAFCDEIRRAAEEPEGALHFFYEQASAVQQSAVSFSSTGFGEISPAGRVDPLSAAMDFGEKMLHSALLRRRAS